MLAQAVLDLFPGATFGIGPPVEDGFYYDFELPGGGARSCEDDLERIDARMREIIAESQPFVRDEIPTDEARELFAGPPVQARDHRRRRPTDPMSATRRPGSVRTYENPPPSPRPPALRRLPGLHRPVPRPARAAHRPHLGHFKLMRVAGAYWRGDEKNPHAPAHLRHGVGLEEGARRRTSHRLEEAAKRDHRKLGVELDLF